MDERTSGEPRKVTIIPKPNIDGRMNVHEAHLARADQEARVPIEARMELNQDIIEATSRIAEQIQAAVSRLDKLGQSKRKSILSPQRTVTWKNADQPAELGWDSKADYRKKNNAVAVQSCEVKLHGSHPDVPDAMLVFQFEGAQIKTIQFIGSLHVAEPGHVSSSLPSLTNEQKKALEMIGSYGLVYGDVDGGIDRLTLSLPTRIDDTEGTIKLTYEEEQKNDPKGTYFRKDEPYRYLKHEATWTQGERGDINQAEYASTKKSRLPVNVKKRRENPQPFHQGPTYYRSGIQQSYIPSSEIVPLIEGLAAFLPRQEVVV